MSEEGTKRRVVVTGFGALTPVGHDAESSWQSFLAGRSGVARIQAFDPSAYPSQLAGEVKEVPQPTSVDAKLPSVTATSFPPISEHPEEVLPNWLWAKTA